MKPAHHTLVVGPAESGRRVDTVLGEMPYLVSRSAAQRLLERGLVTIDGRAIGKRHVLREGECVEVAVPSEQPTDLLPEHIPLDIRYEDDHLIVLSKSVGMVVHPSHGHSSGTLVHALLAHAEDLGSLAGDDRPGIVHRLDKDTTGLMLVAKDDETQAALSDAIRVRAIDRRYVALVHGYIAPDTGLIDGPIARHPKDRMRMAVVEARHAKQAVTSFRVLERFAEGTHDDGFTMVECKLYTGRTHQIRVHMSYIRHPVVGDQLYGSHSLRANLGLTRQFLHSYSLSFAHPITGEVIGSRDPLPDDLEQPLREIADRSMGRTSAGEEVMSILQEAVSARRADFRIDD